MTLSRLVARNAFRNKRRSLLTVVSIAFSLLLLTLMMTIWRSFYIDKPTPESALQLMTRHRVSLNFFLPKYYREKIRTVPGVLHVAPMNWFGGTYKDNRPENFFAQFGTDPDEIFDVEKDWHIAPEQLQAWQRDRAGTVVESSLAARHGWKVGDRIILVGSIFPMNLELTVRGIYTAPPGWQGILYNQKYVDESFRWVSAQSGLYAILVDSPESVTRVCQDIDDMFRNSPFPTKTESEKAFQLSFVAMMGNVKAFILSISLAVVFAILLVSANTMAMSIRERVREVALLETLGFTRRAVLALFVSEAVTLSLAGGLIGVLAANGLVWLVASSPRGEMLHDITITWPTLLAALLVAALVGFVSALVPSYRASRLAIAEGLRHVG